MVDPGAIDAGASGQGAGGSSGDSASGGGAGLASGGSGGSAGVSGGGGDAGADAGPAQAFSPSDVSYTYVGAGPSGGLAVVAATLEPNGDSGPEWLAAVSNVGTNAVCIVTVPADFLDASDAVVGHEELLLSSPMYTSFGSPTQCIGPGDTALGLAHLDFPAQDLSRITHVHYGFTGVIDPAATPLHDVALVSLSIEDSGVTPLRVTGTLTNLSSTSYRFPELDFFPVNSVGRPLAMGAAIDLTLPAYGSFAFTLYVRGPVDGYVTYAVYEGS